MWKCLTALDTYFLFLIITTSYCCLTLVNVTLGVTLDISQTGWNMTLHVMFFVHVLCVYSYQTLWNIKMSDNFGHVLSVSDHRHLVLLSVNQDKGCDSEKPYGQTRMTYSLIAYEKPYGQTIPQTYIHSCIFITFCQCFYLFRFSSVLPCTP